VPLHLTEALIIETGVIVDRDLRQRFGVTAPRLALAGLNPHAGEGGALGHEDGSIIASGDRSAALRQLTVPTLVLHGAADPLIPVAAAHDLARKIPNSELRIVDLMGHDLGPQQLLADEIARFCAAH
jgi:4-hydroxy-L-threonine phosphate dehydrogenase PdxA